AAAAARRPDRLGRRPRSARDHASYPMSISEDSARSGQPLGQAGHSHRRSPHPWTTRRAATILHQHCSGKVSEANRASRISPLGRISVSWRHYRSMNDKIVRTSVQRLLFPLAKATGGSGLTAVEVVAVDIESSDGN